MWQLSDHIDNKRNIVVISSIAYSCEREHRFLPDREHP